MKVLQLRDTGQNPASFDLHPQISVIGEVDWVRRGWLLRVLSGFGQPDVFPAEGLIEAHGIRFDLDHGSLALLGIGAGQADPVVTAAQLPGHDAALAAAVSTRSEASLRRDRLQAELEKHRAAATVAAAAHDRSIAALDELRRGEGPAREALAAAEAERHRLAVELDAAGSERADAEQKLTDAVVARDAATEDRSRRRTRLDAAQNRRRIAVADATQAAAALEAARAGLGPTTDLSAAAASADERLAAAERAAADLDPDQGQTPLGAHLAALERRRIEVARLQAAQGEPGDQSVSAALDAVNGASSEGAPVVAALALADSWRDLHQQISALEAGVSPEERRAEEALNAARRGLIDAEIDFNQPILTPEQVSKVEAAHSAVLEAQDKAEGRFGGSRAKKRLDDLRADERRVLERLGFSTYADYMMSSSSRGSGPTNRSVLDATRANLAEAEGALNVLPGASDRARRRIELLQRRDALAPRVAELLGHEPTGPEDEAELRMLRDTVPADAGALESLADALVAVGVDVGPGPHEREDLTLLARAYLAEEQNAQSERAETVEALTAIDGAVASLRGARDRGETEVPEDLDLPPLARPEPLVSNPDAESGRTLREARWAEVEALRAEKAEAADALARREQVETEIGELERLLASATQVETEAAAELAVAETELGSDADGQVSLAVERAADAERELAQRVAAEAEVRASLDAPSATNGVEALLATAEAEMTAAETARAGALAQEATTSRQLSEADAALATAIDVELAAQAASAERDRDALVQEIDWHLLGRLAAVRSVGPGGSVPLVLDEPFSSLTDDEVVRVLDRLAEMAGAVQIVILSDRPVVLEWAGSDATEHAGRCRAA